MQITITGRYGMTTSRCKIPIGSFFGHAIILEKDSYADPACKYIKSKNPNIPAQLKVLNTLFEDVNCRYSLANSKLMEFLEPILKSETSNIAHIQAYLNKSKETDENNPEHAKILSTYEECITFQHQLNIIRNVIQRLESTSDLPKLEKTVTLSTICLDKLRVLSECFVEVLLHFIIEYGAKVI